MIFFLFICNFVYAGPDDVYPFGPVGKKTDKAYIESSGILEYGLFNVPVGGTDDITLFMRIIFFSLEDEGMSELGGRYILDASSVRLIENNTALSINVKRLMTRYNCNASVTYRDNFDGSTTFWFNFYNSTNNNYETWYFNAYRDYW
jgi:hypothetical protein